MDFITDLPPSAKSGARILLMTTDRLNKGVILIPILSIFTPAVATAFMERYIPYHGFPKIIINNKGDLIYQCHIDHSVWDLGN